MQYNTIVQIGESPRYMTEALVDEIRGFGSTAVIVKLNPADIPGLYDEDEDGHTMLWQRVMQTYGFSAYEVCLWEEGAIESPFYRDPVGELLSNLTMSYNIDAESIYAIMYDQHVGCDCLEDEFRDGHISDCRGSALDVLFPMGQKIYSTALARA